MTPTTTITVPRRRTFVTLRRLRRVLFITRPYGRWLVKRGMPHVRIDGRRMFNPAAVAEWMVCHFIQRDPYTNSTEIVTTRRDLADTFHVTKRTVARWIQTPGFPGTKGRDGWLFPISKIHKWLVDRERKTTTITSNRKDTP